MYVHKKKTWKVKKITHDLLFYQTQPSFYEPEQKNKKSSAYSTWDV